MKKQAYKFFNNGIATLQLYTYFSSNIDTMPKKYHVCHTIFWPTYHNYSNMLFIA